MNKVFDVVTAIVFLILFGVFALILYLCSDAFFDLIM